MIYVVQHTVGGYYTSTFTNYHRTLEKAQADFQECKQNVGDDPTIITLSSLDPQELVVTPIDHWDGCIDDLDLSAEDQDFT